MRAFLGTYFARAMCRLAPHPIGRLPKSTKERVLHLSFDDGPTDDGTPLLLEVLARHDVPATFFLIGNNASTHPRRVREILQAGHALGNHSWSHVDAWSTPLRQTIREFSRCQQTLEELSSNPVRWVRPPYGHITRPVVRWCKRHQRQMVLWDTMPPDFADGMTPTDIVRSFRRRMRTRSIVCLHDNPRSKSVTPAALSQLIPQLIDEGWTFADLSAVGS
ncbi:MAG: polysaccharide deacetylase family protein [Planctomycetota bacterium]|nr:polysaccharide deacetylase family protein [Planctomycetota bacterium]